MGLGVFDRPSPSHLIAKARKALDGGVAAGFPQKVVANALGIAQRELEMGPSFAEQERERLIALLGADGSLANLNARLSAAIRGGAIEPGDPALLDHLIKTTLAKMQVDQPAYPAFRAWRVDRDPG
jgi:hypothetical protein